MKCIKRDFLLKDTFILFLFAFIVGFSFSIYSKGLFFPEPWEYEDIAVNLFSGKGFLINFIGTGYYGYSTPLYPVLCTMIYKIFGHNQSAVILLQIVIFSFLCVVVYLIAAQVFNRPTAILASFLTAIHPGFLIYSAKKLHALPLDALFISLTLYCFILAFEKFNALRFFICGIIFGLCVLTRSTIAPFLLVGGIWLYWAKKRPLPQITKYFIILAITGVTIIGIWSVRNFLVFKRFIPITTVSAEVFWRGNNPNASGTSFTKEGRTVLESDKDFFDKLKKMDELQRYDFFKSEARRFIRSNPDKFAILLLKKFYYFWWFSPDSGKFYPKKIFNIYRYGYFIILLFSVCGIFTGLFSQRKDTFKKTLLLLMALLSISLAQSFFYVEGRHRLAIEPLLLIFAASGFNYVKRKKVRVKRFTI